MTRVVAWLRNDLRVHDNPVFQEAACATELIAVYCLDPRHYAPSPWASKSLDVKHAKTGLLRRRFILEALLDLNKSLRERGSRLLVLQGMPEELVPQLVLAGGKRSVLCFQKEDTSEEQEVEQGVLERLADLQKETSTSVEPTVRTHHGHSLFHRDDLGWDPCKALPLPFGKFFHETAKNLSVREPLPAPKRLPSTPDLHDTQCDSFNEVDVEGLLSELNAELVASLTGEGRQGFRAIGGEQAGFTRLRAFCDNGLSTYHRSRNQLFWDRAGSCLSPWLAHGCLSPRTVYAQAARADGKDGEGFFKFFFELCWRDMFRFYCARNGNTVFFKAGPAQKKAVAEQWIRRPDVEQAWREGKTGEPLVDAIMTELKQTGFATNRARYIVAWYLVHRLHLDWRVGADWFEHVLIDHDVCSNYGEWASMANVANGDYPLGLKGRGPKTNTKAGQPWASGVAFGRSGGRQNVAQEASPVFDPQEQAAQYDRDGSYVRQWLGDSPHQHMTDADTPRKVTLCARRPDVKTGSKEPGSAPSEWRASRRNHRSRVAHPYEDNNAGRRRWVKCQA